MDDRTDEQLIADYRDGDGPAFRVVLERYHDDLMRFLIRFMGDRAAAEDVFQETFLQIHNSIDSFDTSRRFKPWLFTIAANKGRDMHRRAARRPALDLSAAIRGDDGRTYVDLMELDAPAPGDAMAQRERDDIVQEVVDSLPEHHREILLLAYFQKLSYAQTAELLGVPLGTVKSRLHAAVALFARTYKARLEAEGRSEKEKNGGPRTQDQTGRTG